MKIANSAYSVLIVLAMSSVAAQWAWSEENAAANVDSAQQEDGRGGPGGGGGGGGSQRPQPAPVRQAPQPEPVRQAPQPVRVAPQPEPVRQAPQPVRVAPQPEPVRGNPEPVRGNPEPVRGNPEPVRGNPEPVRGNPEPVRVGPQPIRQQPEPFRPGPNGRAWEPVAIRGGFYGGAHWDHPEFDRPDFAWNWDSLRLVTCSAEDSAGNIFPVTEDEYAGIAYQAEMPSIEDAALDMCYDNSGGDTSCYLVGCNPGY